MTHFLRSALLQFPSLLLQVEAWKMARAGLLYTGQDEDVKCSWCGVILGDWQYGEQVIFLNSLCLYIL